MENRRTMTPAESYNHGQKFWGTFAFIELFFSFMHKKTPPPPYKQRWTRVSTIFFPNVSIV